MITLAVRDVFNEQIPTCDLHFLYRFSDGDFTFYIGKSFEVEERLRTHLGVDKRARTGALLRLINDNRPQSLDWTITLYSIQDTESFLSERHGPMGWNIQELLRSDPGFTVGLAEVAMIDHFKPNLNTLTSKTRTPLPVKYRRPLLKSSGTYIDI